MKKLFSKSEAEKKIELFFSKTGFTSKELKKVKRLAMKYKLRLGTLRKRFCKKCLSELNGPIKLSRTHKSMICNNCGHKNKFRISSD